MLTDQPNRTVEAAPDKVAEGLGVAFQLLDVGIFRKGISRHGGLLSMRPGVRRTGRKGDSNSTHDQYQVGFALPADRRRS